MSCKTNRMCSIPRGGITRPSGGREPDGSAPWRQTGYRETKYPPVRKLTGLAPFLTLSRL
jgi:hypothetical protein